MRDPMTNDEAKQHLELAGPGLWRDTLVLAVTGGELVEQLQDDVAGLRAEVARAEAQREQALACAERKCAEHEAALKDAQGLVDEVAGFVNHSEGIAGWHLNGNVFRWGESVEFGNVDKTAAGIAEALAGGTPHLDALLEAERAHHRKLLEEARAFVECPEHCPNSWGGAMCTCGALALDARIDAALAPDLVKSAPVASEVAAPAEAVRAVAGTCATCPRGPGISLTFAGQCKHCARAGVPLPDPTVARMAEHVDPLAADRGCKRCGRPIGGYDYSPVEHCWHAAYGDRESFDSCVRAAKSRPDMAVAEHADPLAAGDAPTRTRCIPCAAGWFDACRQTPRCDSRTPMADDGKAVAP